LHRAEVAGDVLFEVGDVDVAVGVEVGGFLLGARGVDGQIRSAGELARSVVEALLGRAAEGQDVQDVGIAVVVGVGQVDVEGQRPRGRALRGGPPGREVAAVVEQHLQRRRLARAVGHHEQIDVAVAVQVSRIETPRGVLHVDQGGLEDEAADTGGGEQRDRDDRESHGRTSRRSGASVAEARKAWGAASAAGRSHPAV